VRSGDVDHLRGGVERVHPGGHVERARVERARGPGLDLVPGRVQGAREGEHAAGARVRLAGVAVGEDAGAAALVLGCGQDDDLVDVAAIVVGFSLPGSGAAAALAGVDVAAIVVGGLDRDGGLAVGGDSPARDRVLVRQPGDRRVGAGRLERSLRVVVDVDQGLVAGDQGPVRVGKRVGGVDAGEVGCGGRQQVRRSAALDAHRVGVAVPQPLGVRDREHAALAGAGGRRDRRVGGIGLLGELDERAGRVLDRQGCGFGEHGVGDVPGGRVDEDPALGAVLAVGGSDVVVLEGDPVVVEDRVARGLRVEHVVVFADDQQSTASADVGVDRGLSSLGRRLVLELAQREQQHRVLAHSVDDAVQRLVGVRDPVALVAQQAGSLAVAGDADPPRGEHATLRFPDHDAWRGRFAGACRGSASRG